MGSEVLGLWDGWPPPKDVKAGIESLYTSRRRKAGDRVLGCINLVGWAKRLGSAWPDSAWFGTARLGSSQRGAAQLGSARRFWPPIWHGPGAGRNPPTLKSLCKFH